MTILKELFLYFAKYVPAAALERIFTKGQGDEDYSALKSEALKVSRVIFPEIKDYIFGVNEDTVAKRISYVKGVYLFVDYGNITSTEDSRHVKVDEFSLAVTVALPLSSGVMDMGQEVILSDRLLEIIAAIRDDMRNDDSDSFVSRLLFPHDITPFYARELSNSYGWTLMFKMRGVDWL